MEEENLDGEGEAGERAEEDQEPAPASPKRHGRPRGGGHFFKALCPDALVASIIGKGGETRKAIEDETGARLKISGRDEFYPETKCRILCASAGEASQIMGVLEAIVSRAVDVGVTERENRERGKGRRPDETETMFGKEPGEYIFRATVPAQCTGALIGPRGSKIKALREKTGAKVFVDNNAFEGHQMVRLIGTTEAIIQALPSVCEAVELQTPEEELSQWATVMSFGEAGGRGRKGGGKRSRRDEERGGKGGREPRRGEGERGGGRPRSRSRSRHWEQRERRWERPEEDMGEPSPAPDGFDSAPLDNMQTMVEEFPPGALGMAHAISCDLPNYRVGGLIGRRGDYIHHVQRETGTQVVFSEVPRGSEVTHRTMTVTGPLLAVYAAHMMMMRRFHEEEAREEAEAQGRGGGRSKEESAHIDQLQSQLADLERQLAEARGEGGRRRGGKRGR